MRGLGDITKLLKQAQEMKKKMETVQEEIANEVVTATAGGGMVTVGVRGNLFVASIKIDPEIVNSEDVEMLQDLILAAIAEGQRRAQEMAQEKMGPILGGLNIPGIT